jgi:putative tryptophan/tyrosine transport system substrate-binding protein
VAAYDRHECDLRAARINVCSWESNGLNAEVAFGLFMTPSRHRLDRNPAAQSPAGAEVCYPVCRKHGTYGAVKRREFIMLLGGAAAAWPLAARAQQAERMRRLAWLIAFPEKSPLARQIVAAVAQALQRLGWVEGRNIHIEYRFAAGEPALFKSYAADLVGLSPDVILASTAPAAAAMRELTRTIPIVFVLVPDPIGVGFVQSFPRPGGNMTGFLSYDAPLIGKWVQLLKEIAPGITGVAAIFNPDTAYPPSFIVREIEAASSVGVAATLAPVRDSAAIEEVVAAQAREPGRGLMILPDSFNVRHRDVIIGAANRHRLPFIGFDVFATAGVSVVLRLLELAVPADAPKRAANAAFELFPVGSVPRVRASASVPSGNGRGRRTEYVLKWKHDTHPPANIFPTIIFLVHIAREPALQD